MSADEYKKLDHRLVYKGHIVDFYEDDIMLESGSVVHWDYVSHNGAAAVLPVDNDGGIIMVRQYRIGTGTMLLEIPAGGLNPGEDPYTCAVRELEEETGYKSDNVKHLIDVNSAPAYTSETVYVYYAEGLTKTATNYDEDEIIEIEKYTLSELVDMVMNGEITDGKTIAAILAYKQVKENNII